MKIIRFDSQEFIPASHEDPQNPGVLKKVLFKKDELLDGRVQMINWAHLPVSKSFAPHYHEDMEETFIIVNGKVEMTVDNEAITLNAGDAVTVPIKAVHTMKNISENDVDYIVVGISLQQGGKTVNV